LSEIARSMDLGLDSTDRCRASVFRASLLSIRNENAAPVNTERNPIDISLRSL
jgi:hypothetical protein